MSGFVKNNDELPKGWGWTTLDKACLIIQGQSPNYSLDQIRKLPLHLPPLDDQHRIVEEIESRLSVAVEIEEIIDINLKRADYLRQAILKKAFSGRLDKSR